MSFEGDAGGEVVEQGAAGGRRRRRARRHRARRCRRGSRAAGRGSSGADHAVDGAFNARSTRSSSGCRRRSSRSRRTPATAVRPRGAARGAAGRGVRRDGRAHAGRPDGAHAPVGAAGGGRGPQRVAGALGRRRTTPTPTSWSSSTRICRIRPSSRRCWPKRSVSQADGFAGDGVQPVLLRDGLPLDGSTFALRPPKCPRSMPIAVSGWSSRAAAVVPCSRMTGPAQQRIVGAARGGMFRLGSG
jgi:hypothetical protein